MENIRKNLFSLLIVTLLLTAACADKKFSTTDGEVTTGEPPIVIVDPPVIDPPIVDPPVDPEICPRYKLVIDSDGSNDFRSYKVNFSSEVKINDEDSEFIAKEVSVNLCSKQNTKVEPNLNQSMIQIVQDLTQEIRILVNKKCENRINRAMIKVIDLQTNEVLFNERKKIKEFKEFGQDFCYSATGLDIKREIISKFDEFIKLNYKRCQ